MGIDRSGTTWNNHITSYTDLTMWKIEGQHVMGLKTGRLIWDLIAMFPWACACGKYIKNMLKEFDSGELRKALRIVSSLVGRDFIYFLYQRSRNNLVSLSIWRQLRVTSSPRSWRSQYLQHRVSPSKGWNKPKHWQTPPHLGIELRSPHARILTLLIGGLPALQGNTQRILSHLDQQSGSCTAFCNAIIKNP